jgi:ABC-type nitrate/sulfonate/bicarbonate transport system permease component
MDVASTRRLTSAWRLMPASEQVISVLSPMLLLGVWELCARTGVIDTRFFPAPTLVVSHMIEMGASDELWNNIGISLYRLALGFIVGSLPAVVIGLAMGLYRPVHAALDPLISATYPIPRVRCCRSSCSSSDWERARRS